MDELWPNGPRYENDGDAFPLTADSILLADFANTASVARVLELGCGSGIIALLLAHANAGLTVNGIELNAQASACATLNAALNSLTGRIDIQTADLRHHRTLFPAGSFDLVVANPPYFAQGDIAGAQSSARVELEATLSDFIGAAAYALRNGGALCMVHRVERLVEIFAALTNEHLEPKRLRFIHHRADSAPKLVLIEALRGGAPSLEVMPPLILTENGADSAEIRRIYHMK